MEERALRGMYWVSESDTWHKGGPLTTPATLVCPSRPMVLIDHWRALGQLAEIADELLGIARGAAPAACLLACSGKSPHSQTIAMRRSSIRTPRCKGASRAKGRFA